MRENAQKRTQQTNTAQKWGSSQTESIKGKKLEYKKSESSRSTSAGSNEKKRLMEVKQNSVDPARLQKVCPHLLGSALVLCLLK